MKPIPEFERAVFPTTEIHEYQNLVLGVFGKGTAVRRGWTCASLYYAQLSPYATHATFETRPIDDSDVIFKARDNDTNLMTEVAKLLSASEPELGISRAGNITGLANKVLNFTEVQAAVLDLDQSSTPKILMDHNGPSAEASVEYDKVNDRWLFKTADGAAVIGYIDNTGFNNGAP